ATLLGAAAGGRRLPVLVQVNLPGDPGRRGIPPDGVYAVATAILAEPSLRLEGLMTLPPAGADPVQTRRHFRTLREVRDRTANRLGGEVPHLSMRRASDLTVA